MNGLLKRALQLIKGISGSDNSDEDLIDLESNPDISRDDQKDIIKSINSMVQKTKITVTPDLFKIKANKRGVIFPLIINIAAAVILVCTVFGLYVFFQRSDAEMLSASSVVDATSSKIIQQLKQQAQREMDRLNAEKAAIENSLASINANLQDLQANMDDKINSQVKELRDQLNAELEAERRRLVAAGTSQAEIDRQLELLRSEKDEELDRDIAEIRAKAEADKQKQEEELRAQQAQFSQALAAANKNLTATQEKYAAELASREQAITQAQDKINELSRQREKFQLTNDQIIGYYKLVQDDLTANKLDSAVNHLDQLNSYLSGPAVLSIPDIARRYEVELFVIQSLKDLITSEQSKASADTRTIITQSQALTEIRAHVLKAGDAFKAGDKTTADQEYLKALELIPEINQSHTYFMEQLKGIETYRTSQVDTLLAAARTAYDRKQYAQALTAYGRVLDYLPSSTGTGDILKQISTAGANTAAVTSAPVDSAAAAQLLAKANTLAADKNWDESIKSYLTLISQYPQSTQVKDAVKGIDTALTGKNTEAAERIAVTTASSPELKAYEEEIAALKATVNETETKYTALESGSAQKAAAYDAEIIALKEDISTKEKEIAVLRSESAIGTEDKSAEIAALKEDIIAKETRIADLQAAAAAEKEKSAAQIAALQQIITERETEITALKNSTDTSVGEYITEISALKEQIKAKETEIAELEGNSKVERQLLTVEIADLKKTITEKDTEMETLKARNEETVKKYETEIAALTARIDSGTDENLVIIAQQKDKISELESFSSKLKEEAAVLNAYVATGNIEIEKLKENTASLQELLKNEELLRTDAETKMQELNKAYADFITVRETYADYVRRETAVVTTGSLEELTIGKSYLDSFLATDALQATFPGLLQRIKRYDQAFEQAGRIAAITDMLEIIRALNNMSSKTQQAQYIDARISESEDELFAVLLRSLRDLVQK